jgi:hypothetical protein
VSDHLHTPAALCPGKEPPVSIALEVGWAPEPVWTTWGRENILPYQDSNSDPSVVQPVVSHYTYYDIPAVQIIGLRPNNKNNLMKQQQIMH